MNELEWLSSHPEEAEKCSGRWIAVTDEGIIASGESLSEVESSLKSKGMSLKEVMVMKMPRKDEEMSIL
ncbi:hypothetical protein HYS31_08500 [Candidatus Woesearchaeota archaeon]|nr:hypothetical protein [Candidatus Woesearchaeota archaeon]